MDQKIGEDRRNDAFVRWRIPLTLSIKLSHGPREGEGCISPRSIVRVDALPPCIPCPVLEILLWAIYAKLRRSASVRNVENEGFFVSQDSRFFPDFQLLTGSSFWWEMERYRGQLCSVSTLQQSGRVESQAAKCDAVESVEMMTKAE